MKNARKNTTTRTPRLERLERERRQLELRRNDLRQKKTVRVGIHGVPNAGKTSYFLGMYLHRMDRQSGMSIRFDESSAVYLRRMADYFMEHGRIESTGAVTPKVISFIITTKDGAQIRVETMDFAGHFVEPRESRDVDLAIRRAIEDSDSHVIELSESGDVGTEARRFMANCNTILCLADCRQDVYPIQDAVDLLPPDSTVLFIPTKIDELLDDPEVLLKKSRTEVQAVYESVKLTATEYLERYFRAKWPATRYRCVPVAALGPIFHRGKLLATLPINPSSLRPFNLYRPWQIIFDATKNDFPPEERELNRQIVELERQIAAEQKTTEQKANARERRATVLQSRLEKIEGEMDGSMINPSWVLISFLKLRGIAQDAKQECLTELAKRANRVTAAIVLQLLGAVVFIAVVGLMIIAVQ